MPDKIDMTPGSIIEWEPKTDLIPLCVPDLHGKEAEYAADAIGRGHLTDGDYLGKFKHALQEHTGNYCSLVSSCSAGLALSLKRFCTVNSIVIPDWTFAATVNAALWAGIEPEFCGVGPDGLATSKELQLVVDILGQHGTSDEGSIIDAAQSFAEGGCDHSRKGFLQVTSFNSNKIVCAAGGGAVFSHDKTITDIVDEAANHYRGPLYSHRHQGGFNFKMSNVQAAIGLAQMETLEERAHAKQNIWERYANEGIDMIGRSTFLSVCRVKDAFKTMMKLREHGIESTTLWQPMSETAAFGSHLKHLLPCHAHELWRTCLALPCSSSLTYGEQTRVIKALADDR